MVGKRPDQDAASVVAAGFSPLPQQRGEVPRVAGHEYAILLGRQRQHLGIVECPQCSIGGQAHHVMASPDQNDPDPLG